MRKGNTEARSDLCILGPTHDATPLYTPGGGSSLLLVFTNVGFILLYYSELHPSELLRSE